MFRVGTKNGQTVYWDGEHADRFICVAMSPVAAEAIAEELNLSMISQNDTPLPLPDWALTCPIVPKRET